MASRPPRPRMGSRDQEIAQLKARLAEAEETLRAIRAGEVDALVVNRPDGDQIFTLQGAETPYRFLIEEMNEGALLLAPEGTILYANAAFARLADSPLEQVIGRAWEHFFPAREHPRLHALLQAIQQGGLRDEFHLHSGKEATRPVELSVASLKHERIEGFSVVVRDLTRRKAQEAALRRSVAELEAFSYSLSHDLRAPIRAIRSFSQIVRDDAHGKLEPETLQMLERVTSAASRMDALIQDVLALTQLSREEIKIEPVDIQKLVRELIEERPELQSPRAEIKIVGRLLPVCAHRASLTQCLTNILGNAVKFVPAGVKPKIRLWAEERPEAPDAPSATHSPRVRVWIEDNGIGIDPRWRERIFEIFTRLHRDYEGTGIGLAIVRKAVERMGGAVGVESNPGKGSRFWLELKKA